VCNKLSESIMHGATIKIFILSVCSACTETAERCPMDDVDVQNFPYCVLLYSRLVKLLPVQNESRKQSLRRGHHYTKVVVRRIARGREKRERVMASGRCWGGQSMGPFSTTSKYLVWFEQLFPLLPSFQAGSRTHSSSHLVSKRGFSSGARWP
jgi:hypothetical protein